ncbi:uncharacterized protein DUF4253 [Asanoa ferruginea]|uniref:Uncharacterized protein DUF4253 n=1 Tax=Asanoa ferruginea TaxID=53367 RepID=A0A3D9ZUX1_9ACTN|nr:DUF4253 domain-containing protein [Asanoa ferruginea]REG01137.1 uncharacterized protein DUF4253 [Asanoa ferruginea]GIF47160.1 hypothetical protein Afe04nite_16990 [Asanoa ferruginea]
MARNPLTYLRHDPGGGSLSLDLPPGRAVHETDAGVLDEPVLWISDTCPDPGLWGSLQARHGQTGLWPLLLGGASYDPGSPWTTGELFPGLIKSRPGDHDAAVLLAGWWSAHTTVDEDDDTLSAPEQLAVTAPFGDQWPGLAPAGTLQEDPAVRAAEFADHLVAESWLTAPRLGLSASARGADAPADLAWGGPLNYENDTAQFSAVLRSWEERFGARVVGLGPAELYLSIAAPPTDADHALHVAAEHFAFCPDNVWQSNTDTLIRYAESLTNQACWSFWWD